MILRTSFRVPNYTNCNRKLSGEETVTASTVAWDITFQTK